jgi:hypothetical protein
MDGIHKTKKEQMHVYRAFALLLLIGNPDSITDKLI